jgi:hypothetical protein
MTATVHPMSLVASVWLLLAAVALALPVPASARVVNCGEVIKVDTRVDNDLVCPTRIALEIGGNCVHLDLRGHTIEAVEFVGEDGITHVEGEGRIAGYDDVSVANGTVIGHPSLAKACSPDRAGPKRIPAGRIRVCPALSSARQYPG